MLPMPLWQKLNFHDKFIILWWCRWLHFKRRFIPDSPAIIQPPPPDLPLVKATPGQLHTLAQDALQRLDHGTPAQRRRLLRGLIHQVTVAKTDTGLRGTITYYPPTIEIGHDGAYTFTNPHSTAPSHRHNIPLA